MSKFLSTLDFGVKSKLRGVILTCCTMVFASVSQASVYISSDNQDLRNSLNVLANAGLISIPVQQFPMPWRSILLDLETIDNHSLNKTQQLALMQVRHYLSNAQNGPKTYLKLSASSEAPWLNRFGRSVQEQGKISIARHFQGEQFAGRLQLNHRWDPYEGENKQTLDGSYLAYNLGDVSLSLDALPLWWGPSQHSSLLMSTNARAVKKLRFDYSPDYAPIGLQPLHISAFIGRTDTHINGIGIERELAGLRMATRFDSGLTAGLSAIHQTKDSDSQFQLPENTMVSLDIRQGWQWQEHHFAIYGEVGFDGRLEDGEHPAFIAGAEWQFNGTLWGNQPMRHTIVVEYSDTKSKQFYQYKGNDTAQRYYQHEDRILGSSFAPDSKTLSASYRLFAADGSGWTAQVAHSKLTDGDTQQQALLQRSQPLFGGLLNIGFEYNESLHSDDDEVGARISWEWRF